jgi:predicted enzyme related to lactoylglutathione lyase
MSSSKLSYITVDVNDMKIAVDFWCAVLGATADGSDSFKKLTLPNHPMSVFLQLVPEPKTSKSRMHLDLTTADLDDEISRFTSLGATVIKPPAQDGFRFAVFQDPFGKEF